MKTVRCILAALLLLVFGGGMGMAEGQPDDMAYAHAAIETSADETLPGGCDRCDESEMAMSGVPCAALGNCFHGVVPPAVAFLMRGQALTYVPYADTLSGFQGTPDPFPPRSDILA